MNPRRPSKDQEPFEIDPDEPVFTTGVVCRLLGIPVWILKQLDREGIVSPPRRNEHQSRLYSKRQLLQVRHCWYYMNEHGVKIQGLKIILKIEDREE
jgi:DNA-binding transcriptional MerR regulator